MYENTQIAYSKSNSFIKMHNIDFYATKMDVDDVNT